MPIGPYENWDACIRAQRKLGHSKESSERICGAIEAKVNESKKQKKRLGN